MSSPLYVMVPLVAGRKRVSRLKQVVLPAPFGPISAWMVPRITLRSTRFTATNPRNSFDNPRVSRITSESDTRLHSRKPPERASAEALERCDPGAASPALLLTSRETSNDRFLPFALSRRSARRGFRLGAAAGGRQSGQPAFDPGQGQARLRRSKLYQQPAGRSGREPESAPPGQPRREGGRHGEPGGHRCGRTRQPAEPAEQGSRPGRLRRRDGPRRDDEERHPADDPAEAAHGEPGRDRDGQAGRAERHRPGQVIREDAPDRSHRRGPAGEGTGAEEDNQP